METAARIESIVLSILNNKGIHRSGIPLDESLLEDGLGLDSMDLAELSVTLERRFGRDPYSEGTFSRTLRELCAYYDGDGGNRE